MARKRKPEEEFDDAEFFEFLDEEGEKDDMQWYAQFGASKIIDFRSIGRGAIFLGNIYQAAQLAYNNELGITAVLDVSTENDYERHPDIIYLRVPFPDGHEIPPEKFAQCMAFLKFCWEKNMTILVNCAAGISRSTSIVVSFLHYEGLGEDGFTPPLDTMEKILDYVRLCRPIAAPAPRVFNSCKQWLRVWPYDGSHGGYTPPKNKLDNTVTANMLKMHIDPECEVRQSILANDDRERHLLKCTCRFEGKIWTP
jgi:predicted protein tyrosine phosphatase